MKFRGVALAAGVAAWTLTGCQGGAATGKTSGSLLPRQGRILDLTRPYLEHPSAATSGTRLIAPAASVEDGATADALIASSFILPAVVIDIREPALGNPDYRVEVGFLEQWQQRHGDIERGMLVVLEFGWIERDGRDRHPSISPAAAEYLVRQCGARILATDLPSLEPGTSREAEQRVHEAGAYLLVEIAHLDRLPTRGAVVVTAPSRIPDSLAVPARVFALLERRS